MSRWCSLTEEMCALTTESSPGLPAGARLLNTDHQLRREGGCLRPKPLPCAGPATRCLSQVERPQPGLEALQPGMGVGEGNSLRHEIPAGLGTHVGPFGSLARLGKHLSEERVSWRGRLGAGHQLHNNHPNCRPCGRARREQVPQPARGRRPLSRRHGLQGWQGPGSLGHLHGFSC